MPPLNTHLVIGERVFHQKHTPPPHYGYFLLGCLLVDVNSFSNHTIDRRVTHFVGRLDEDGAASFTKSCANFLDQMNNLLKRPWNTLTDAERAFVTGYLCHLAADETWKAWGAELRRVLKITSFNELSAPPDVILTAFSVLSHTLYQDFATVDTALSEVGVPDIFTHVPHRYFQMMWTVIQPALRLGDKPVSYFMMLERAQTPATELQAIREAHATHWDEATVLIQELGGVAPFISKAIVHVLDILAEFENKRLSF